MQQFYIGKCKGRKVGEMAQWVTVPATKPDNLSLILKETTDFFKLCSDPMCDIIYTHTQIK